MVNSRHTLKSQRNIIATQQIGAAASLTLEQQIAFFDAEIKSARGWATYYARRKEAKHAANSLATVARFEQKREILLAKLYASQMPNIGGACVLIDLQTQFKEGEL
jgi:hypothetical protein